jgi:hypothetical protein
MVESTVAKRKDSRFSGSVFAEDARLHEFPKPEIQIVGHDGGPQDPEAAR